MSSATKDTEKGKYFLFISVLVDFYIAYVNSLLQICMLSSGSSAFRLCGFVLTTAHVARSFHIRRRWSSCAMCVRILFKCPKSNGTNHMKRAFAEETRKQRKSGPHEMVENLLSSLNVVSHLNIKHCGMRSVASPWAFSEGRDTSFFFSLNNAEGGKSVNHEWEQWKSDNNGLWQCVTSQRCLVRITINWQQVFVVVGFNSHSIRRLSFDVLFGTSTRHSPTTITSETSIWSFVIREFRFPYLWLSSHFLFCSPNADQRH